MDSLRGFGHLSFGSRLKRFSDYMMRETQLVYDHYKVDFDPYLFPVFKTISNKKNITNTELVEQLKFTQPAITQFVNKLIKKGLVQHMDNKTDKRKKNIQLTPKGKELLEVLQPIWIGIDRTINEVTQYHSASFLDHINYLEDTFKQRDFSKLILNHMETHTTTVSIIDYNSKHKQSFYDLNIEWLKTYFYVEPYDEEVLSKPDTYIIGKGGHIFFTLLNNEVVGTVALMPTKESGVFELTKMAVSPEKRGFKIGQKLMQHCIDFAKDHNFEALMLYSNTKLENAIYIYRKYGFIEIPVEPDSPYKRSDIKMILTLD